MYNIKKLNENKPIPSSPGKSRPRLKTKTNDLPEGQKMAVRNTLYNMYKESEYTFFNNYLQGMGDKDNRSTFPNVQS